MYTFKTQIRVRYAETDQMGYMYHGNYPSYFEQARVEAFRAIGVSYKKMEEEGVGMPVMDLQIKYHNPARYDDLLTVVVKVPEMPRARIKYHYEIYNEEEKLITSGETTLVFMDMKTNRAVRPPKEIIKALECYFG